MYTHELTYVCVERRRRYTRPLRLGFALQCPSCQLFIRTTLCNKSNINILIPYWKYRQAYTHTQIVHRKRTRERLSRALLPQQLLILYKFNAGTPKQKRNPDYAPRYNLLASHMSTVFFTRTRLIEFFSELPRLHYTPVGTELLLQGFSKFCRITSHTRGFPKRLTSTTDRMRNNVLICSTGLRISECTKTSRVPEFPPLSMPCNCYIKLLQYTCDDRLVSGTIIHVKKKSDEQNCRNVAYLRE